MQRSIVAALVAISLGACSSDDGTTAADNLVGTPAVDIPVIADDAPSVVPEPTEGAQTEGDGSADDSDSQNEDDSNDVTVIVVGGDTAGTPAGSGGGAGSGSADQGDSDSVSDDGAGSDSAASDQDADNGSSGDSDDTASAGADSDSDAGSEGAGSSTAGQDASGEQGSGSGISDDAGSATSDGGQTADDTDSNQGGISDDAGSATSDGGQTADDGDAGSEGGISDDAGSATSDGGQTSDDGAGSEGGISDDAGSATSDGGQGSNDDAGNDTGNDGAADDQNTGSDNVADDSDSDSGGGQSGATDFESGNTGGSVIRRSVLAGGGQVNICTTAGNQENFSDTRIGDFILHNNAWRPWRAAEGYDWTQCIYTNTNGAVAGWNYDWGPGISGINGNPDPSGDYYVRSYPELIYGVKDEFRTSAPKSVTGLPVRMSEMPNITISYSYDGPQYGQSRSVTASNNPRFPNGTTISGERNIAIESFLYNPDASGECSENIVTRNGGSNHVYEVMVWLDAGAERLPAGPSDFVTNVNIRGEAFKVYTKGSDNRYVAFVAQNPQSSGSLVWNDFTDWARTYAHRVSSEFGARSNSVPIQDSWCVANIIVGTEIFWGAGNLDIYDWTITQSR